MAGKLQVVKEKTVPPLRIANKAEVAEFFQTHISTVDAWLRRDCPYIQRGGRGVPWKFDLLEVARWRFGGTADNSEDDPEKMSAKERLDWYRGNREKRLDALEDDAVVDAEEARTEMANILKNTMLMLDTLTEVAERQAKLSSEQAQAVESIIDRERRALYARLVDEAEKEAA